MPICRDCKQTYKNLSNHHAQGLCNNGSLTVNGIGKKTTRNHRDTSLTNNDPLTQASKRVRTMNSSDQSGKVVEGHALNADSISVLTPNSIMNHVLDSTMQPGSNIAMDICNAVQLEVRSETEIEDNSSACIIAMLEDNVAAFTAPHDQDTNGIENDFDIHETNYTETVTTTKEDRLLIRLSALCTRVNAPLYLVDDIVEIFRDETLRGLILDSSLITKRRSFLKRMCKNFPSPIAQKLHIGLEGNYPMNYNYQRGLRDSVSIVSYDFVEQLNDLLNDVVLFGNVSNFVGTIDPTNPFSNKPPPTGGLVDEVHDGKWYQDTVRKCSVLANGEPFMVLPIIGYVDKTGTDVNQRNKLEPFSFTLSILNRDCRFTTKAWRVLGFLPDLEHKSSASMKHTRRGVLGKGKTPRNYHRCLSIILESLSQNQGQTKPIYGCIQIGNRVARRRLFFPLAYIIGDALSGDQLCGRYKNYSPKVARLSRCCDVKYDQADDLSLQCKYLYMSKVQTLCRKAMISYGLVEPDKDMTAREKQVLESKKIEMWQDLKRLSTHMHLSAFDSVWFGDNPNGIYGATPTDLMHAFLQGIIPYVIGIILYPFTTNEKDALDNLCDKCFVTVRSSEKKNYPRCNFSHGITKIKLLTASEWAGMAFTIALMIRTEEGLELFNKVCERSLKQSQKRGTSNLKDDARYGSLNDLHNKNSEAEDLDVSDASDDESIIEQEVPSDVGDLFEEMGEFDVNNQLYILEMILCFHAWYKCGAPYSVGKSDGYKGVDKAIRLMLQSIKKYIPRNVNNGWKLQKFHDLLHVTRDMQMFGCPQNWDASPGEHNLIEFAKRPSRRTQKRHSTFVEQVATRLHESTCIQKALSSIMPNICDNALESLTTETTDDSSPAECDEACHRFATLLCAEDRCRVMYHQRKRDQRAAITELHPIIIHWFENELANADSAYSGTSMVTIYSEYHKNDICYCAHPNYHQDGPWYDWVMVSYEYEDDSNNSEDIIEKAKPFLPGENPSKILCFFVADDDAETYALVQSCNISDHEKDSILFQRWSKEYISRRHYVEPMLRVVSVDSFGCRILVIEDDNTIYETIPKSIVEGGITVVTPRTSHWPDQFASR